MFPIDTKFLIVDDSSTMRKIVRNALGELGYKNTEEADDGATALPVLQKAQGAGEPFQVIFCDANMPIMKGFELLKACKSDPYLKAIPFIMATVESERHQIAQAMKAGAAEYVIKPFDAPILREKLAKVYVHVNQQKTAKVS